MSATTTTPTREHTIGDHGQTDFDAIAAEYDDSLPHHVMDHYLDKRAEFIRRYVAPGSKVLDVGCGTGVIAKRLAAMGYDVTGMDPFDGMLAYLRQRAPEITAVQGRGEAMPFADNTFDLAYCVAVMHHVADPVDVHDTLKEMVRVTKPGAHILIWDHNPRNPYWPLLMKRVPQDTGAERLIPEQEILDGLAAGGAWPLHVEALGLMPDFTPKPLVPFVAKVETVVEHTPLLNRLCAHNVILAVKAS